MKTKLFRKLFPVLRFPLKTLLIVNCQLLSAFALWGQNGISISDFSATVGSPTTVTFKVAWNKKAGKDTAWVFVDYNDRGTMTRLSLENNGHTASPGTITSPNKQGAWVIIDTPASGIFMSTISLHSAATYLAGACVYAVNYFPKGRYTSASTVVFNGTPKYDVVLQNAGSIYKVASPYKVPDGDALRSFTDATGAPGAISCLPPNPQSLVALSSYCAGASGVDISLANTQKGVIYELVNEDSKAVVATQNGLDNGGSVSFGTHGAGSYSVRSQAAGAFCAIAVSGTHTVTGIATPAMPGTSTPASVCQGSNLTFIASGSSGNYNWEGDVSGDGNNLQPAATTAKDYKARVRAYNTSASGRCYSDWSGTVTGTIKPNPTIALTSGNNQTSQTGASISAITFATTHASGATITSGEIPSNLSGAWSSPNYTITGAIASDATAKTYNFTVTTSNANDCSNVSASGAITVQFITPSNAKTTTTWTVSGNGGVQVWSDVINVPACNKTTYSASSTTASCRNNGSYGYLYSWVYVKKNANTLCDNGWRVPTNDDFCNLDKNLNSSTSCSSHSSGALGSTYNGSAWGGAYGGYCTADGQLTRVGSRAYYWSITELNSTAAYYLCYNPAAIYPQDNYQKAAGVPVRCVK
jgi:uncharacterized protein (TIGR02145 family)